MLKTTPEIFTKIVREAYTPSPMEFMTGAGQVERHLAPANLPEGLRSRMSRFLVTGATGFLGRHLVTALRAAGHDVVALCRKDEPRARRARRRRAPRRRARRRRACAPPPPAATRSSTAPARSRASPRTPRSSTGSTSRAPRSRSTPAAPPACAAWCWPSTSGVVAVSEDPKRGARRERRGADEPARALALLPLQALRRARRIRSQRPRLRGGERQPDAAARARATCTARRPATW